jgi:hypothetical protein
MANFEPRLFVIIFFGFAKFVVILKSDKIFGLIGRKIYVRGPLDRYTEQVKLPWSGCPQGTAAEAPK